MMISYFFDIFLLVFFLQVCVSLDFSHQKMHYYRNRVKNMFYHAYNGYLNHAYPLDELKPITCSGMDTWGSFSLTLVDALDTLILMGNYSEFERASRLILHAIDFNANINVSVFETNIRVIGGLLSAHMLSRHAGVLVEDGWPCNGPLLRLAERLANKLLPAFHTYTGMPFGTVNLRYGVHKLETPITCTAGVGTFLLEFGTLSRLTGNPRYERVAMKAMNALWASRSQLNLVGNHINTQTGQWTASDAGIGAGVDSYFEYLVKGAILFEKPELMRQFQTFKKAIDQHCKQDDWFMWVSMTKGHISMANFQSLEQFWPGLLTLVGEVEEAQRILLNYRQVLKQYGFSPEFYNIPNSEAVHKRSGYPLRPELVESLVYIYQSTKDPLALQIGVDILEAIEHSAKTPCGYATVHNVLDHTIEDRMESFFLAETTKYLYLLFDPENFVFNPGMHSEIVQTPHGTCSIYSGGWIFNTEAHPLDPGIIYCCSERRQKDVEILDRFQQEIDLLSLMGLNDRIFEDFHLADGNEILSPELIFDENFTGSAPEAPDIGYEVEKKEEDSHEIESEKDEKNFSDPPPPGRKLLSVPSDSESQIEFLNAVGPPKEEKIFNEKLSSQNPKPPGFHFASASAEAETETKQVSKSKAINEDLTEVVMKALRSLMGNTNDLFQINAKMQKVAENVFAPCQPYQLPDCDPTRCRIIDRDWRSANLNLMLNLIYGRTSDRIEPICLPSEAPKESDQYNPELPDFERLKGLENSSADSANVDAIRTEKFMEARKRGRFQYQLMSCPARPAHRWIYQYGLVKR